MLIFEPETVEKMNREVNAGSYCDGCDNDRTVIDRLIKPAHDPEAHYDREGDRDQRQEPAGERPEYKQT
jgi:hypothetical protein